MAQLGLQRGFLPAHPFPTAPVTIKTSPNFGRIRLPQSSPQLCLIHHLSQVMLRFPELHSGSSSLSWTLPVLRLHRSRLPLHPSPASFGAPLKGSSGSHPPIPAPSPDLPPLLCCWTRGRAEIKGLQPHRRCSDPGGEKGNYFI